MQVVALCMRLLDIFNIMGHTVLSSRLSLSFTPFFGNFSLRFMNNNGGCALGVARVLYEEVSNSVGGTLCQSPDFIISTSTKY